VRKGDTLILCSDGLSGQVRRDEIAKIVAEEPDLIAVCKTLIDRANEAGGPDNITVIAARFDGDGLTSPTAGDPVGHAVFSIPDDATPTAPVPTYVRRHSGTPPMGEPAVADPRKTVEVAPAKKRPQGRPLMIVLGLLTLAVASYVVFDMMRDRNEPAPAPQRDSIPAATPATPDSARLDSAATAAPLSP
jgi:protein phosphatase